MLDADRQHLRALRLRRLAIEYRAEWPSPMCREARARHLPGRGTYVEDGGPVVVVLVRGPMPVSRRAPATRPMRFASAAHRVRAV